MLGIILTGFWLLFIVVCVVQMIISDRKFRRRSENLHNEISAMLEDLETARQGRRKRVLVKFPIMKEKKDVE